MHHASTRTQAHTRAPRKHTYVRHAQNPLGRLAVTYFASRTNARSLRDERPSSFFPRIGLRWDVVRWWPACARVFAIAWLFDVWVILYIHICTNYMHVYMYVEHIYKKQQANIHIQRRTPRYIQSWILNLTSSSDRNSTKPKVCWAESHTDCALSQTKMVNFGPFLSIWLSMCTALDMRSLPEKIFWSSWHLNHLQLLFLIHAKKCRAYEWF